ncbi:dienelactone hydrolase family protein [Nocardioides sp. LHG3406-4]|uniref:dienelactone hydrolase family protein n=1 Tax=Nocardioides sp. LHG3406-4 TaxID=2804575 RepID=UPI003CE92339
MPTIEIPAADGAAEAYLSRPSGDDDLPGVLFYVDAIGLRPRIEEMADRIASWGYVVLAPHLFYREGRAADLAPQEDLRAPEARERFFVGASKRVAALTPDLSNADAPAWLATLREHAAPGPVGITGYCMGARLAVRSAAQFPDDVRAVGGWHGGGLVTDAGDSPHRLLDGTRAAYVFGHADQDPSMPAEAVAALGEALTAAGVEHSNEIFPGAPHGYSMSDTSVYDADATERHFTALRGLLDTHVARS